uniref:KANL2-like probable zinc-finger domain-containing protein n=1 Tax=Leersia perrieri TaxID=77586 RepID=A0A0D9WEX1_9ORYZ
MEATAEALTREEVLRRRRRRAKRLVDVYRRLYWTLGEELRARHRQYVWELGRSPLESEQPQPPQPPPHATGVGGELVVVRPASATVPRRKKCGFAGCKVRAMAMARFCHSHILSDPKQVLYKSCAFITKSSQQVGQMTCGKPIIKASVPSLCNTHFPKCQRLITQGYKKVGFNPPPTGNPSPNFSLLVAECVRQIQAKRRESPSVAARKISLKDGKMLDTVFAPHAGGGAQAKRICEVVLEWFAWLQGCCVNNCFASHTEGPD